MPYSGSAHWPMAGPLIIGIAGGSGSGKTSRTPEQRAKVNYDPPDSMETELLVHHLAELRAGRSIERPVYDFSTHNRAPQTVRVDPRPAVIVEGILVLYEPSLRAAMDLKVYVDTDPDLRLARRWERDIKERGRTFDSVRDQYLETVRPMHLQFVEPSKRYADIVIPEGYNLNAVGTVISMIRDVLRKGGGVSSPQ